MRFLVDERVSRRIVDRLIADRHDVVWIAQVRAGDSDRDVLRWSFEDSRILLTADWDFGELVVRFKERAFGIVIVAISQFSRNPEKMAENVVRVLNSLDGGLIENLTIIEAGRVRQLGLGSSD